jgi:deoxyhypusine synthase
MSSSDDLALPQSAVLLKSTESAACHGTIVAGYDFDKYGIDYERLLDSYMTTGYQATNLAIAIEIVNRMIADRQRQPIIVDGISTTFDYPVGRAKTGCTIFLGYTSNLVSCGLREV